MASLPSNVFFRSSESNNLNHFQGLFGSSFYIALTLLQGSFERPSCLVSTLYTMLALGTGAPSLSTQISMSSWQLLLSSSSRLLCLFLITCSMDLSFCVMPPPTSSEFFPPDSSSTLLVEGTLASCLEEALEAGLEPPFIPEVGKWLCLGRPVAFPCGCTL